MINVFREFSFCLGILFLLFLGGTVMAVEYPTRSVVSVNGKNVAVYVINGLMFREVNPITLDQSIPDEPVALLVRLLAVEGDVIQFYGDTFERYQFSLQEGVSLQNPVKGTNLLICGTVKMNRGSDVHLFPISQISLMPDDFSLLKTNEDLLQSKPHLTGYDYLVLGDWIDKAFSQATISDDEQFRRYEFERSRLYRKGLELELEGFTMVPGDILALHERFQSAVAESKEEMSRGVAASAFIQFVGELLKAEPAITRSIEDGEELSPVQCSSMTARGRYGLGALFVTLLNDEKRFRALCLEAAILSPQLPLLVKPMTDFGYLYVDGKWLSRSEASSLVQDVSRKKNEFANEEILKSSETVLQKSRTDSLLGLKYEEDTFEASLLLGIEGGGGIEDLAKALNRFQLDVAQIALFEGIAWYGFEKGSILIKAALDDPRVELRGDALALLLASDPDTGARKVIDAILREEDVVVASQLVYPFIRLPEGKGIEMMIAFLERTALPLPVRQVAWNGLKDATHETFGLDPFPWKRWWAQSKEAYLKRMSTIPEK